jgi:coenzyme F420-0:L-glutamate ligase/coenzyme F420-1:gamma-L-glutamate ligase
MPTSNRIELFALDNFPLVEPGDDLVQLIANALAAQNETLHSGDVVVLAQKIVSKSENRYVNLADVTPSEKAQELAKVVNKPPQFVELVLRESTDVVRQAKDVLIVRHRHGYVYANAGIDQSNIQGEERVLLLPENPDDSALRLRDGLSKKLGVDVAVVINDSAGRPWRMGVTGIAIGVAGLLALHSRIGDPDLFGKTLQITEIAAADEIAAAASFLMGQADEGTPVVVMRGARYKPSDAGSAPLIRPRDKDLFK